MCVAFELEHRFPGLRALSQSFKTTPERCGNVSAPSMAEAKAMRFLRTCLLPLLLACTSVRADEHPDLNWLAGAWCSHDANQSSEEHWLAERGGLMLGVNRTVTAKGASFEFLRIELAGKTARFVAQPGGAPPTRFDLVSAAPNSVTFANPQHDFPKRIRYARDGELLTARVDNGHDDATAQEFKWSRCTQPPN
jgi:Domain of unknown function (DUF6265)